MSDDNGRIMFTASERKLMWAFIDARRQGTIRYIVQPQLQVRVGVEKDCWLDFAMPDIKLGVQVDSALFHSTIEQRKHDKDRDDILTAAGWKVLRFMDTEIDEDVVRVVGVISKYQDELESNDRNQNC